MSQNKTTEGRGKSSSCLVSLYFYFTLLGIRFITTELPRISSPKKISSIDLTEDGPASSDKPPEDDDSKLSLITWNVDGLDTDNLAERARGLCSFIVL